MQQWLAGLYVQCLNLRPGEPREIPGVLMQSQQINQLAAEASWLQDDLGAVL